MYDKRMPPKYDPQYDIYHQVTDPAEQWIRDRGIIASWLKRQADNHFSGAERRLDGTSNATINSAELGHINVHDYWSFCRPDFNLATRQQSYAEILARQEPILSFDYLRTNVTPARSAQLVVFLNGEMDTTQGYAETFDQFTRGQPARSLIAVESDAASAGQTPVDLYRDPFFVSLMVAVRQGVLRV